MGRRRYRRHYRRNNIFGFTRNERELFNTVSQLIKIAAFIIVGTCKGAYYLSKYIRKGLNNYFALKKIGYNFNEVLNMVYTINPRQFEVFCAELFRQHGYKVKLTPPSNDFGRDIILNDNIFVECKHYRKDNYIGREICQKLLGSCQMFKASKAIIITTGQYHKNAYECAKMVNNLQLMDITDIQEMILNLKPEQLSKVIMRTLNCS